MLTLLGLLSLIYPFVAGQENFTSGTNSSGSAKSSTVFDLFYKIQTNQIIGVRSCRNLADCGTRQRCDPLLHLCLPADYPPLQEIEKSCHVDDDCSPLYSCIGYLCRFCGPKHCGSNTDCCPGVPSGLQYQCLNTEGLVRDQVNSANKKKTTRMKREAEEGSSGEESESDSESGSDGESENEEKSSKKSGSKSKSDSKSEGKKGSSSKKSESGKGKSSSKKEASSKKESSKKEMSSKGKKSNKKAEEEPVEEEAAAKEENEGMAGKENEDYGESAKGSSKSSSKMPKSKPKENEDAAASSSSWGHSSSLNTWGSPNSANTEGATWGSQDSSNFGIKPATIGAASQGSAKMMTSGGSANSATNLINHLMSQYPLMTGKHCISQCITDYDCYRLRIPEEFRNNITCCQGHCFPRKLCLTNMQSGSPISQSFLLAIPQTAQQPSMTYQIQLQLQPQAPMAPAMMAAQAVQANQATTTAATTTTKTTTTAAPTTTTTTTTTAAPTTTSPTRGTTTVVTVVGVTAENATTIPF